MVMKMFQKKKGLQKDSQTHLHKVHVTSALLSLVVGLGANSHEEVLEGKKGLQKKSHSLA
jgi:hypothetical protein